MKNGGKNKSVALIILFIVCTQRFMIFLFLVAIVSNNNIFLFVFCKFAPMFCICSPFMVKGNIFI